LVIKNIIKILFIIFCELDGLEIDMKMLNRSDYVELVKFANGDSYLEYHDKNSSEKNIVTPLDCNIYEIKPVIKFFDRHNKEGVMAIVSLADGQKYLNASCFNKIVFDGDCKNCTVSIADKRLFLKEDNIKIGKFKKRMELSPWIDKIDLRQLKYIVLFAPKREDIEINRIKFIHTDKKSFSKKTSVWIWRSKDIDISKIKKAGIKNVYLQVDDKFEENARILDKEGVAVYALDGDPSYIFDDRALMSNIEKIININKTKKIVQGFQIDIEPHTLKDFSLHKKEYLQKLIVLSKTIDLKLKENGLLFSVVIPFWYDGVYVENKSVAYSLIDICDEVVLMSYRTDPKEVLKISADKLTYAEIKDKKVKLGIELMPIPDEYHELFDKKALDSCDNKSDFPKNCKIEPFSSFVINGTSISFSNQKNRLKYLINTKFPYSSFTGFVYHHIGGI